MVDPTKDQTALTIAKLFWEHMVQPYGCPKKILSDQGLNFELVIIYELCRLNGIRKAHTTHRVLEPMCSSTAPCWA